MTCCQRTAGSGPNKSLLGQWQEERLGLGLLSVESRCESESQQDGGSVSAESLDKVGEDAATEYLMVRHLTG